ncbi:MAG: rhodanese-like domain-containing protein [Marinobacter sp.]
MARRICRSQRLLNRESRIAELNLDQSRPVVLICLSAHRSIPATRKLIKMGFDAKQLKAGMKAW